MHLVTRSVNTAFRSLVTMFVDWNSQATRGINVIRRPSRNGSVLVIDEPVTITYTHPRERVLFNQARDANPFALLYEAMWMLAGRNDVESLAYYCKRFRDYSDDGTTLNGAYGYRWRHALGSHRLDQYVDQLDLLVSHLNADPTSRRAVLQMWNVEDDLLKLGHFVKCEASDRGCVNGTWENGRGRAMLELGAECPICKGTGKQLKDFSKDVCCNLSVMFSLQEHRRSAQGVGVPDAFDRYLDMTVTNRSNDLVWGLLGANYVCFSVLQEYMAARLGVEVGKYHHFTNNLHVYDDSENPKVAPWRPAEWLASEETQDRRTMDYSEQTLKTVPLVCDPEAFERELPEFVQHYANPDHITGDPFREWTEPFLATVANPMVVAFLSHRRKCATTLDWAGRIAADDWRVATINWLKRRVKNHVG